MLEARRRRRRTNLRGLVQTAKEITPGVVSALAELTIADDEGYPIRPAPHHRLWLQLLCDERIKRLAIIAPPDSAKTTWLISAFAGTYIGVRPENNVIIAASSGDVARRRSVSLRASTESEAWREIFPNALPASTMTWEQREWSLAPGGVPKPGRLHPTVAAYGTGGSITGSRADLILADDILDNENTRTMHQRRLVIDWFYNSVLTRAKGNSGRVVVIGTSWTHDDLYARIRKDGNWVVCHTPLLSATKNVYAYLTYPDDWQYEVMGEQFGESVSTILGQGE